MAYELLVGLGAILVLGILAQWVAWYIRLPAILVLLVTGFVIGPITGFLQPDLLFGEMLFPVVSISVAVILFEGGLKLEFARIADVRGAILRLVTIGTVVTWASAATLAYLVLGLELNLAVLLGAILVVTGPTVIVPLLRDIRPTPTVGAMARWEGIINDPVGTILAVLVFEGIVAGGLPAASLAIVEGLAVTIVAGTAFAALGAFLLVLALRHFWIPDYLESPATLAMVVSVHIGANLLQPESGLLAVTLMGVILANQSSVDFEHIVEFKENLRVVLISGLFVLLAARVDYATLQQLRGQSAVFLVLLVLAVRPAAVAAATWGTDVSWRERVFLSVMAPRGIVAAAVSSLFALELATHGVTGASRLLSETFLVITGTVVVYGFAGRVVARWLGLGQPPAQGVVFVGAETWVREIALALDSQGIDVLVVSRDPADVDAALSAGLRAHHNGIAHGEPVEELELTGFGRLLAMTPIDEVNVLASLEFSGEFQQEHLYRLAPRSSSDQSTSPDDRRRGRVLFGRGLTFDELDRRFRDGAEVHALSLTEDFDYADFRATHVDGVPLFAVRDGELKVCTADQRFAPRPGDTVICLSGSGEGRKKPENATW